MTATRRAHHPARRRPGRRRGDRGSGAPGRGARAGAGAVRRDARAAPPRAGRSCSRCRPGVEAERLAADLREYLGDDAVELFPAWETLPFERVSPATETMGRRLRVIWRLRAGGDHLPAVDRRAGARARAAARSARRGRRADRRRGPARSSTATSSSSGSSTMGYRREYQVEARGEVAVRGSIVDVYPSTADHPVRIDLWGDEVDRLSQFSVADQRSTVDDRRRRGSSRCASCSPTDEVRARAAELLHDAAVGSRAVGAARRGRRRSTAWSRGCRG